MHKIKKWNDLTSYEKINIYLRNFDDCKTTFEEAVLKLNDKYFDKNNNIYEKMKMIL